MGKRNDDGTWHDNCLEKLHPGEPFFVLRAQDQLAPRTIRAWARDARQHGLPNEKYKEALQTANEMELWPNRKMPD